MGNRLGIQINGPQSEYWPDFMDAPSTQGEPLWGRARAWARGDVGMRAIDGVDAEVAGSASVWGFAYTRTADNPALFTVDWRKNIFVPTTGIEAAQNTPVYVLTGPCAQNKKVRGTRFGTVWVKADLASVTVTAGMRFKLVNAQVHLAPAEGAGAGRIVARATHRYTAPGTGVQLVPVEFIGEGAAFGIRLA